jgi:hypothetical protein
MAWTTPRSWVAGEVVTAALLNTHVRDNLTAAPRGWLGYAQVTANQSTISTEVDLTSLAVTVTVGTSRRIRISGRVLVSSAGTADVASLNIKESTTQLSSGRTGGLQATPLGLYVDVVLSPSAGSHTYKLTMAREVGANALTMTATSTVPAFILVEDLGLL